MHHTLFYALFVLGSAGYVRGNNPLSVSTTKEWSPKAFSQSLVEGDLSAGMVVLASFGVGLVLGGFTGSYITSRQFKRVSRFRTNDESSFSNSVNIEEIRSLDTCLFALDELDVYHVREYSGLLKSHQLLKDELLARDYEEFKVPDLNNDDVISYREFVQHAESFKKGFPDATASDFPDFAEMDSNADGEVTFDEWLRHVMQLKGRVE